MPRNRKMTITFTFNGKLDKRNVQQSAGIGPVPGGTKRIRSEKQGDHLSRFESIRPTNPIFADSPTRFTFAAKIRVP